MKARFNVTGKDRKNLVAKIEELKVEKAKYLGVPSCAYQIGAFEVSKTGELTGPDDDLLLERLVEAGFDAEVEIEADEKEASDASRTSISLPLDLFTDEAFANLNNLVEQKGTLMKRAFLADELPIEKDEKKVSFPWFPGIEEPDELQAYATFIQKIVEMAKTQKRISAKEKEIVNEKYEFRCFLLRLGMIGNDYKAARKVLLRNLSGSAAFKDGAKKGGEEA